MKLPSSFRLFRGAIIAAGALLVAAMPAAEPEPPTLSAGELAARMSAARQGNAVIRARLEMRSPDGSKRVLQLQIRNAARPPPPIFSIWSSGQRNKKTKL